MLSTIIKTYFILALGALLFKLATVFADKNLKDARSDQTSVKDLIFTLIVGSFWFAVAGLIIAPPIWSVSENHHTFDTNKEALLGAITFALVSITTTFIRYTKLR